MTGGHPPPFHPPQNTHTEKKQPTNNNTAFKVSSGHGKSASLPLSAHQTVKLAQLVDRDEMRRGLLRTYTVLLPIKRAVTR